jgi:hypothetical protein
MLKDQTTIIKKDTAKPANGKAKTVFSNCYLVTVYFNGIFFDLAIS